jgi:hypothetical protein
MLVLVQSMRRSQDFEYLKGDEWPKPEEGCLSVKVETLERSNSLKDAVGRRRTVFKAKTPMTFSIASPVFGNQPNSVDRPFASHSTLFFVSCAEYDFPESPQVNGGFDLARGCRPYSSLSMNSLIGIESGGSKGIGGHHDGDLKICITTKHGMLLK